METGGPDVVGVSQDEKTHAMLSWILMIVASFVAPLIFLLIDKEKPFVYRHAAQGLAYFITIIPVVIVLWIVVLILTMIFAPLGLLFIPMYLGVFALNIYVIVMGAINANKGLPFDPPFTSQVCKMIFKV